MSDKEDNTEQTEQITKEPEQKPEKTKDPKKVEAGKRLAQYHKKAKQALEKEKNKHETNDNNVEEHNSNSQWMPEISLTTGLTLVGITLTAIDLYFRWRKSDKPKQNVEIKQDKQIPKPPSKKIGME